MQTFAELIERFGGAARMAPEIGVSANVIRQWSSRGSIPGRYWLTIIDAAKRLGIEGVDAAALASIATTKEPAAAAPKRAPRSGSFRAREALTRRKAA
jgi:hypothetical protein